MIPALLILAGTYHVLSIGRLPRFRIDRTGAATIGAGLMIGFQVLTMDEAIRPINYETLILLFGMMIVVANLRLSAFFVNDTMCLVPTPLVLDISARLRRNLFSRISQGRHPPRRSFSSGL